MQPKASASQDGCRVTTAYPTRTVPKSPASGRAGGGVASIPGVAELWAHTRGDSRIRIAVLDGPVDVAHPCFRGARLTLHESAVGRDNEEGPARRHGTHVASVIFGRGGVEGLAPLCHGLIIPIFGSANERIRPCSQLDLAHGILRALEQDAHLINISAGELSSSGEAETLLASVIADCARRGVLIVAAAGNDGCPCLHVPAAHRAVLAVGAMDEAGEPLAFSNWGAQYHTHGIVAPGEDIVGARAGGGTTVGTGSSYAAAVVTGVAALLLSLQLKRGQRPDTQRVREALLRSVIDCATQPASDCRRLLAGRLDVRRSTSFVTGSMPAMSDLIETTPSGTMPASNGAADHQVPSRATAQPGADASLSPSQVQPAACACQPATQIVLAIGQIGYSFVSEARLDSIAQEISAPEQVAKPHAVAFDPEKLLPYLKGHKWEAAAVTWTLSLHGTPIYAIQPAAPFAGKAYKRLREFLYEQAVEPDKEKKIERISVGGVLAGMARLLNGHVVPLLVPEIRTMFSWSTKKLLDDVVKAIKPPPPNPDALAKRIGDFLDRVNYHFANAGVKPQDRALNYLATNVSIVGNVMNDPDLPGKMELESIEVRPSSHCRTGSDCWDVDLYFFDPANAQTLRKVYRVTVDVSDVAPVFVGPLRHWSVR